MGRRRLSAVKESEGGEAAATVWEGEGEGMKSWESLQINQMAFCFDYESQGVFSSMLLLTDDAQGFSQAVKEV
ncbi:hypothetical protein HAX54_041576 [Datura stramonium]|uniref:Uncharacterized protein n=1 Tax=Datura stramonium TaxID=4076 RepID=A0ABS8SL40_DATST|nr:hypothetical protein [Datura stramonium]